jgi:hypothetical protein
MAIKQFASALRELVDETATPERIATGFEFTEGPLWNRRSAV